MTPRVLPLTALLFMLSCDWNGVVLLENDGSTDNTNDSSDTATATDTGTAETPRDTDTRENRTDSDSNHPSTDSDSAPPDMVVLQTIMPPGTQSSVVQLCGYFFDGGSGPDYTMDPHFCIFPQGSMQGETLLSMPRGDLTGPYHIAAVLYVEGGAASGTPPVPGVDFSGLLPGPVQLFEGMGVVVTQPMLLNR